MSLLRPRPGEIDSRSKRRADQRLVKYWAEIFKMSEDEMGELIHTLKRQEGVPPRQAITQKELEEAIKGNSFQL